MISRSLVFVLVVVASTPVVAQDASHGRLLAANCANCHGTDGRSQGGMPSLAGQPKSYLVTQLKEFKAGQRPATIMHQLAKGYTDAELDALATYFSAQKN